MRVTYQNYFRGFTKNQPFAISITNSAFPETSNNDPTSGSTPAVLRPARQASVVRTGTNQILLKMARIFLAKRAKVAKKVQSFSLYLKTKASSAFLGVLCVLCERRLKILPLGSGLSGLGLHHECIKFETALLMSCERPGCEFLTDA